MNLIVLLKQVPDTTSIPQEAWDQEKGTLKRNMLDNVLNPHDLHALSFACRLRKEFSPEGRIVCITMGIASACEVLLDAMVRGADEGILLSEPDVRRRRHRGDREVAGAGVRKIQQDLFGGSNDYIVIAGMQSVDGDTAQVPPQLAGRWGST